MKLFLTPPLSRGGALAFDLDGTLYDNHEYMRFQERSQTEKLAAFAGLPYEEVHARVRQIKQQRKDTGLPPTSMANIFLEFGVPFQNIIEWRIDSFEPARWLAADPALRSALSALKRSYALCVLTNNPHRVAEESLRALGIGDLFDRIIALDDTRASKPNPIPFKTLIKETEEQPEHIVVIGDRYSVDIEPALAEGMQGILVDTVREIDLLPSILLV